MSGPLPPEGYLSSPSRTTADMQAAAELVNSVVKEILGGGPDGDPLLIISNIIKPTNNACVFPVDASSGHIIQLIDISDMRDGQLIFLRCANATEPITLVNLASGAGGSYRAIATYAGSDIVMDNTAMFISLRYDASVGLFQEFFPYISSGGTPDWASPGTIGSSTPNTGAFTTLTATTPIPVSSGGTGESEAGAGTLFGVFGGSTAAPTFNAPGSADQLLGVTHDGASLEYKDILGGSNVTVTAASGSITISAGGFANPMTALGDLIIGSTGGTAARLAGNSSATKEFLTQTGTGSASAAPQWGPIASADLPSTVVTASGGLTPLFSTNIASQTLTFSLTNSSAGTILGNFTGSSAAPSYNAPGTTDQLLSVAHAGGGLEWKSLTAGANITITPTTGGITIASSGFSNPMTTLGDIVIGSSSGVAARLPGNTTTTREYLSQTGTGSVSAAPQWNSISAGDLPSSVVSSTSNLSPLFSTSISSQTLNFSLNNASAGTLFGNFSGSSGAPSFNAPGTNDQILGVVHSGTGLEFKSVVGGANVSVTSTAGQISISSVGNISNPMTTLGDMIYGGSVGTASRLAGSTSSTKKFLIQTGTGSASAAPVWGAVATGDLPSSVVASSGNLSPLFTSSIASQALSFSLSNASAGTIFGNFSSTSAAPSFNAPGSSNQVLGVAAGGGLEFKTITAGSNITVTNSAGAITIASSGGGSASFPLVNNCRLYTSTGAPYTDTDSPYNTAGGTTPVNGVQTLYFGPCNDQGNRISLYSSGSWSSIVATETSVSLGSITTPGLYDVYAYNNSGSVSIQLNQWTSSNTVPTSKTLQDGQWVLSTDTTKLYVGTIETATNVISGTTTGCVYSSPGYRGIWNAYNRRPAALGAADAVGSWTYTSAAWRIANGRTNTLNSYGASIIRVVVGMANCEPVSLTRFSKGPNAVYTTASFVSIGIGNTTPVVATEMFASSYTNQGIVSTAAPYAIQPSSYGALNYQCLEYAGGTCSFWGGFYGGMYGLAYC